MSGGPCDLAPYGLASYTSECPSRVKFVSLKEAWTRLKTHFDYSKAFWLAQGRKKDNVLVSRFSDLGGHFLSYGPEGTSEVAIRIHRNREQWPAYVAYLYMEARISISAKERFQKFKSEYSTWDFSFHISVNW